MTGEPFNRQGRRFAVCLLTIVALLTGSRPAQAQDPETREALKAVRESVIRAMLRSLGPNDVAIRGPVVDSALAVFPGCGETFLIGLISTGYLESLRTADPWTSSLDPGPGANYYSGRDAGFNLAGPLGGANMLAEGAYGSMETLYVSPLVLDLDMDGTIGASGGTYLPHVGIRGGPFAAFDINGDGFAEITEWVHPGDGLLVGPEDPSKVVVDGLTGLPAWSGPLSGRDLFGTAEGYLTGFEKMLRRDRDGDGVIAGEELAGLYVWDDKNQSGTIELGELLSCEAIGVEALRGPTGGPMGSCVMGGTTGTLWDWWPSYALARKRSAQPLDPVMSILATEGPPVNLRGEAQVIPGARGRLSRDDLIGLGVDYETLIIVDVARGGAATDGGAPAGAGPLGQAGALPGGGAAPGDRVVALDRAPAGPPGPGPAAGAEGPSRARLWVFTQEPGGIRAEPIYMPEGIGGTVDQVVFSGPRAMVIAQNGARLLSANIATGEVTELLAPEDGKAGFRAGPLAWWEGEDLVLTGYFYDEEQRAGADSLALVSAVAGGFDVSAVGDLAGITEPARSLGGIVVRVHASRSLAFFGVLTMSGSVDLVASSSGNLIEIDRNIGLGGIAASGERVLYFRNLPDIDIAAPILPGEDPFVEAVVHDVGTGEEFILGRGRYLYPYLAGEGRVAVVSTIDWADPKMTFHAGRVGPGGSLVPLIITPGVGALRVSKDGLVYGYMGPDGLRMGPIAFNRPFRRGDVDGDGKLTLADAIAILLRIFVQYGIPCEDAADVDDNSRIGLSDVVLLLLNIFTPGGAPAIPEPTGAPGPDPTEDPLGCGA